MRSNPKIVSLVRAAWAWDEDKNHQQNEAAVELQAKGTDENDRTVVHHIPAGEQPIEYVLKVLDDATQYIDLSVLAVDHGLADALRKRLTKVTSITSQDDHHLRPDHDQGPRARRCSRDWTLHGFRQRGIPLLVDSDTDDTSSREAQIHRLNQHARRPEQGKVASTVLT